MLRVALVILFSLILGAQTNHIFARTAKVLTLEDAQRISDAAEKYASENNWHVVIAILDGGGNLIALRRMDGTQVGSIDVAQQKARSAFAFKRSTKVFEDAVKEGKIQLLSLPGIVAVEGGIPIELDGEIIGAIGISGVTSAQDGMIAVAGLAAL